jgi:hypothetical protein
LHPYSLKILVYNSLFCAFQEAQDPFPNSHTQVVCKMLNKRDNHVLQSLVPGTIVKAIYLHFYYWHVNCTLNWVIKS